MKKNIITVILLTTLSLAYGQSNTFPTTGNVGIGTVAPQSKLEIQASTSVYDSPKAITITHAEPSYYSGFMGLRQEGLYGTFLTFGTRFRGTDYLETLNIGNGKVGIGTSNPQAKLHIDFGGEPKSILFREVEGNAINSMISMMRFKWHDNTADFGMVRSGDSRVEALAMRFNEQETVRFTPNGNVGIGTTSPQAKLDVNGGLKVTGNSNILYSNKIVGWDDPNNYYIGHYPVPGSSGLNIQWHGGIKFGVGGNRNAMQILEDGKVGIGTSNPQAKLHIDFGGEPKSILFREVEGNVINSMISMMRFKWHDNTADFGMVRSGDSRVEALAMRFNEQETVRFTPNGNVGVGTTSPQAKLHIDFGGEPKSILFREVEGNAINSMISMMRFQWHDNTADFGMVRSGDSRVEALAMRFNEQETARFTPNGNVSIKNKLEAKEVKVTTTPTADFVFAEDYQLPKLEAVEKHIKEKKHLPEIASAKEMEKEGVNVGEFQIKLLQKIEELTLYSIEQNKRINELESQNKELLELKKQFQILTDKSKK